MLRDGSVNGDASWCGVAAEGGHAERCARLHRRLRRIVKARGALDAQEAETLREAERLRVWRHFGYSSLLEYMEIEMGYSPRAAIERLRVANAIVELPAIAEALTQGDLSFSAARELTRVATPETEQVWLESAGDKNLRQVEQLVSGHKPGDTPDDPVDPKLRKRAMRFDELDEETVALLRQARQILDRELGDRLDNNSFLRALGRMVIDGNGTGNGTGAGANTKARLRAPYQIAVITCEQCKRAWQDGGGITVEMSPAMREVATCDAQHIGRVDADSDSEEHDVASCDAQPTGRVDAASESTKQDVASCDAEHIGRVDAPDMEPAIRSSVSDGGLPNEHASRGSHTRGDERSASVKRARTAIPPALRRKVSARDHGRCRVPWCRASRNIDQHHIRPISEGGEHTLENLITLCESHHIALHEGALILEGDATSAQFTRRAHGSFEATRHAVEAAEALRTLGFKPGEVKTAIEKTRTHVGTSALGLEQWIRIALSFCPRPVC